MEARILHAAAAGRLAHAYLAVGGSESDCAREIAALAMALCCDQNPAPCGSCAECERARRGAHPDMIVLEPEPGQGTRELAEITVGQVRELRRQLAVGAWAGSARPVIIRDAHAMNAPAQSAFLKTLEEPPARSVFLLCARNADLLLPTIRSRTQILYLGSTESSRIREESNDLLRLQRAPMAQRIEAAKALAQDPPKTRVRVRAWISLGRQHLLAQLEEERTAPAAERKRRRKKIARAARALARMEEAARDLEHTTMNTRLALEHILLAL